MTKTISVLRDLHQGKEVEIEPALGDRASVRAKLDFSSNSSLPIYIGALGHQMLRLAGKIADGVLLSNVSAPKYVQTAVQVVKKGLTESSNQKRDFEFASYILALTDDSPKTRQRARERIASLLSVPGREE